MYDEILPRVGAFAIRPGNAKKVESQLKDFITMLTSVREKNVSRLNRLMSYAETVLSESPVKELDVSK